MEGYSDLAELPEDTRIQIVGQMVMFQKKTCCVCVDKDVGGAKGDRYITKFKKQYPGIVVLDRFDGPVANVETIKLGPPNYGLN